MTSLSRYAPISSTCRTSGMDQQVFEQIERRGIEPLQIVEEQGQRMLGPSEHPQKPSEHELETSLRVLWRQFRDTALVADDEPSSPGPDPP